MAGIDVARRELSLSALVPLGSVAKAHFVIAHRHGTGEKERGDRDRDQQRQLQSLSVDESGAFCGVAGGGVRGSQGSSHDVSETRPETLLSGSQLNMLVSGSIVDGPNRSS
jgi:hypothetical protein